MAVKRLYFRVYGKVQGIGYRYFVWEEARALGLTGFVRNLSDGNVDGEAQGADDILKNFINTVHYNHPWACVKKIETHCYDDLKPYKEFVISGL